ncbi:YgaP family membrane protein [Roseovarius sp. S1116L3]|uniref:YgaP family membrane protein n=1 Tax=Roseovarius roseus TaxID=3342636 RepID=UPI003729ABC8
MSTNEGTFDRVLRGILGFILVILPLATAMALFANPVIYWGALIVGAVLLITALTGFCPLYRVLGVKTCTKC